MPHYLPCREENGFNPDFDAVDEATWQRCQILFLCSPGNPTGALVPLETLKKLIALADRYDFVIAADECYSELYFDENARRPACSTLAPSWSRTDFSRCVVFHSLSKRSNLPGLRSGFVAGDAEILKKFLLYRTYHGCAMPVQTQLASIAAWNDEVHVRANRSLYRENSTPCWRSSTACSTYSARTAVSTCGHAPRWTTPYSPANCSSSST